MKKLIVVLSMLITGSGLFAQSENSKSFEAALIRIDCETIKFIHKENKRDDIAKSLHCLTFESTINSIPESEKNTTGKLAREIKDFAKSYDDNKPLDAQLDAVISFVEKKIKAKPRKGSVADFMKTMTNIKKETLEITTTTSKQETATKPQEESKQSTSDNELNTGVDSTSKSNSSTDWFAYLIALIALLVASFSLFKLLKLEKQVQTNANNNYSTEDSQGVSNEVKREMLKMESRIIADVRKIIAETSVSTTIQPTLSPTPSQETKLQPIVIEEDIIITEAPSMAETSQQTVTEEEENEQYIDNENLDNTNTTSVTEIENEEEFEEETSLTNQLIHKYTGLSVFNGFFPESTITNSPTSESVFVIGYYETNPETAYFVLLNNPDNIRKCLQNPNDYLLPYCEYIGDTNGKTSITFEQEGVLKLQDGKWNIIKKVKISLS